MIRPLLHALRDWINRSQPWTRILILMALWWVSIVGAVTLLFVLLCGRSEAQVHWRGAGTQSELVMRDCTGGDIAPAYFMFAALDMNGTQLRFTGTAASACTIALGFDNVSWSRRAAFNFHALYDELPNGARVINREATASYLAALPPQLRACLPDAESWGLDFPRALTITGYEMTAIMNGEGCPPRLQGEF